MKHTALHIALTVAIAAAAFAASAPASAPASPSAATAPGPLAPASRIDFLIPGISLESLSLAVGARVSYLVITHSFGTADSSFIEIRVLDRAKKEYSIELTSSPYPKSIKESMRVKMRVDEGIARASSPAEVRSMIHGIHVRKGTEPYRAPTAEELEEADIGSLFKRPGPGASRSEAGTERVSSPAGAFLCNVVEYASTERRAVTLGGVAGERLDTETSRVWLSKEIPFWGLVKSRVERTSSTTVPGSAAGVGEPKTTLTESIILSFHRPRARR